MVGTKAVTVGDSYLSYRNYALFADNDKRRDATVWDCRGVKYTKRYEDTGLWLAKYRPFTENNADAGFDNNLNYNNNLRVYRLAEAYLNAAELLLETGGDANQAKDYVNKIRNPCRNRRAWEP